MRIREIDDLADWFKVNVWEVRSADSQTYDRADYENSDGLNTDVINTDSNIEALTVANDELSLIEYIIGIDGINS